MVLKGRGSKGGFLHVGKASRLLVVLKLELVIVLEICQFPSSSLARIANTGEDAYATLGLELRPSEK